MRKKCYQTCLKRIEKNPNDVFAMNCAAAIGGRVNINRFGQNMFGNEAVIEKHTYLYITALTVAASFSENGALYFLQFLSGFLPSVV